MLLPRAKALWWTTILALVIGAWFGSRLLRPRIQDRVYTIGWQSSPPFQQKAEDGSPAGLAIDLVRDAARRRGIRLKWVWHPDSSEAALRSREVDLWPLMTITPEREKVVHISKPYLQHNYTFTVLASSRYYRIADLETATVSLLAIPIMRRHLSTILPRTRPVSAASPREAVENVCARVSDAALLDEFTSSALFVSGLSCPSQPLRMLPVPALQTQLGVGSTPEASAVADEIRSSIDTSFDRGDLAAILRSAGYFSSRNMDYFSAMLDAQRRERWLRLVISAVGAFLALALFAAVRMRAQRNRIRAADDALRLSEQKLRIVTNNLKDMVLAFDMEGRLIFANPAVERLTGYSIDDLQNGKFAGRAHPDDRARMSAYRERLLRGEAFQNEEYKLLTKDGQVKWVSSTWAPMYDEAGRQIGVQGCERDITETRLAEESLRESERRFRDLLERVQLVALMTDVDGAITFCNDYTLALTGWSREEVVGQPARDFLDPELPAWRAEPARAVAAQPFFEGAILTKSGGRRWIEWTATPLRDSAGRAAGFASIGEDVTELRALRAEAARRESEAQFHTIADTAPLMIWVAGPDKRCTFVNKGWLAFSGRTFEEELGDGWLACLHPDDRERCYTTYAAAFDARRGFQVEKRVRRADGEYRWVLSSGVPRYGPDGEFAGYVGNFNDITEFKRSRDEDITRQKMEMLGGLAGGIAHDFNNLLGAVLAQADLAAVELAEGLSPAQCLKQIRGVAIRGSGIVRQLMIYAGQDNAISEPVDITNLARDMLELLRILISKHAALQAELADGLPAVNANPAQLRQVIMNLVTNASDAIGDRDGVITLRTAVDGGCVALEVSDTGCGISAEAQPRLFDPFFTTKPTGHGLGLPVVHRIVQRIGGVVRFDTQLGRGTTFRALLPSIHKTTEPAPAVEVSSVPDQWTRSGAVLIVEDEDLLRIAVARMLRKKGLRVLEAPDGTVALDFIRDRRESIDVVLLDITLPGAPSREVLAEARRLRPGVRIIITSAYGESQLNGYFPGMKIDAFIRKPFQVADLMSLLRNRDFPRNAAASARASVAESPSYPV
jgi:PAS domain S-box-containing protein